MSIRALIISAALVVLICGFGYFTHHVAGLPSMIGGAMPLIVFGTIVVLALGLQPLLVRLLPGRGLRPGELAVILALGASVCGYTGASYLRYLGSAVTLPAYTGQTEPAWQATQALAYVPGHAGAVAPGHVARPRDLARQVVAAGRAPDRDDAASRLWRLASANERQTWRSVDRDAGAVTPEDRFEVAKLLNAALTREAFAAGREPHDADRLAVGRRWLEEEFETLLLPPPAGAGVLLNDGRYDDELMAGILFGQAEAAALRPAEVPWRDWWPVVRLWGGLMLLMMLMAICLSIIVRQQWSEHERLAFPLVRFAELIGARDSGQSLPRIAHHPMFWGGFALVFVHLVNGLHDWFPRLPHVPLEFDFSALRTLFPNAARTWASTGVFEPTIYPTVIAFAFFLPRSISLTFGITTFVYLLFASQMIAYGIRPGGGGDGITRAPFNHLMSFGAMLGMCGALLYTGRRYYGRVAHEAVWPSVHRQVGRDAVWAFRLLLVLLPLSVYHLVGAGLSPLLAGLAVAVVLLLWLVNARLVSETGMLRFGNTLVPVSVAAALFGLEGIGPTAIIVLTIVGILLATDLWETPMAYTVMGMEAARRNGVRLAAVAPAIAVVATAGLVIALVATLAVQYRFGILGHMSNDVQWRSNEALNHAARAASELAARDQLVSSLQQTDLQRLSQWRVDQWSLGWIGAGLSLFVLCAAARLRWPWWSIHPAMFILLGNWGTVTLGFSFLFGWMVKAGVVGLGGARAYHQVMPMMAGVIAAGLLGALFWLGVGGIYFITTGRMPST